MDMREPLYGRCDALMKLLPFETAVLKEILSDYPTYSGLTLEIYFRQQLRESLQFRNIGAWWQAKKEKDPCEIDIVAIYADNSRALVAEVKRQRKNFKPELFQEKVATIRQKLLSDFEIEAKVLTMEDM